MFLQMLRRAKGFNSLVEHAEVEKEATSPEIGVYKLNRHQFDDEKCDLTRCQTK